VVAQIVSEASAAKKRLTDAEEMRSQACNEVRTDPKKFQECYLALRRNSTEYRDQLSLILSMLEAREDLKRIAMKKSQDPQLVAGFMQGIPQNVVLAPEAKHDEVWVLEYSPTYSGSRSVIDEIAAMLSSGEANSPLVSELNSLLFPLVKYPHPYDWNIRVFLYPSLFAVPTSQLATGSAIPITQGISAHSSYEMHTVFWSIQKGALSYEPRPAVKKENPFRSNPSRTEGSMALESGKATIVFQDFSTKDKDEIEIEFRGEKRKVNLNEDSSLEIDIQPDESMEMKIKVLSEGSVSPCTIRVYASEGGVITNEVVLGGKVDEIATLKIHYPTPFEDEDGTGAPLSPLTPRKTKPRSPFWSPAPVK
jgi:hypothetical protein